MPPHASQSESQSSIGEQRHWRSDENCVRMMENSESQSSELLTQNAELMTQNELTQLGEGDDGVLSPLPQSPMHPKSVPWGRLIPCSRHAAQNGGGIDLLPKDVKSQESQQASQQGVSILGLDNLKSSDIFNEYLLGRSNKCDVIAQKSPPDEAKDTAALQDWAHAMISNRHCRIYCMLKPTKQDVDVYIEDTSGNGTLINNTTHLRRGEKRLLHTGDEICLVNPTTLRKKIRSKQMLTDLQRHYSFIFVNVLTQQQRQPSILATIRQRQSSSTSSSNMRPPFAVKPPRKGIVDVRAMNNHSIVGPSPSGDAAASALPCRKTSSRQSPVRRVEQVYDIRDLLGSGTCGQVRRAIHRHTGQQFAVKIIPLGGRNNNVFSQQSAAFEAEVSILKSLDHPYVVKLVDVFVSQGQAVHVVLELLQGDLFDRIVQKGKYSETESRRVMRRLLNAIYYLHEVKNVVHRDLKPENILCSSRDSDIDVQLTDFGLAKSVTEDGLKTFCGTPQYYAPEVLRRAQTIAGRGRYGKEADMWSLGVILYILLSGQPPFDVNAGLDCVVDAKITFPDDKWIGVSDDAKDLVCKLLVADPTNRESVKDACNHPWILTNDGDTHIHPLDDPAVSHVFDNVSDDQSLASNRRLFPQDESVQGATEESLARNELMGHDSSQAAASKGDKGTNANASVELSTAETTSCSMSGATEARGNDENVEQSSLAEPVCPMSQGTIHASNAANVKSKVSIPAPVSSRADKNAPTNGMILLPRLSTSNVAEPDESNEHAPLASVDASQPATQSALNESTGVSQQRPVRLSLNARSNNFRALMERNIENDETRKISPEKKRGPRVTLVTPKSADTNATKVDPNRLSAEAASIVTRPKVDTKPDKPKKKKSSGRKQKVSSVESRAAELSEDEICSEFSDEDDSVSSCSTSTEGDGKSLDKELSGGKRAAGDSTAPAQKRKKRRIVFGALDRSSGEDGVEVSVQDAGKGTKKSKASSKAKSKAKGTTETKASKDAKSEESGGRQTTLSSWFRKQT